MPEQEIALILRRLDALEATLSERNIHLRECIEKHSRALDDHDHRLREVEVSNAKLFVMVTGGGAMGGAITAAALAVAKGMGLL